MRGLMPHRSIPPPLDGSHDPATVLLDGQGVREVGRGFLLAFQLDVNEDGLDDLVMLIDDEGVYSADDTVATLTGQTYDGILIRGTDSIQVIVPPRHWH